MKKYLPIFISLTLICFIYKQYKNSLKQDKVDETSMTYDEYIYQKYNDEKIGTKVTPLFNDQVYK